METDASAADDAGKRPGGFGGRFLTDETDVFQHNAWDNVRWSEEEERAFQEMIRTNSESQMEEEEAERLEESAACNWDKFYSLHNNRFFKDRQWLLTEFPQLLTAKQLLEVGCGVGNTVLPLLRSLPSARIHACDYSSSAVQLLVDNAEFDSSRCHAFVWDVSRDEPLPGVSPNSLDAVLLVFALSALQPKQMEAAVRRVSELLRPGGRLLFRDYGRCDLAQVRFKPGRCIGENFYARGDGTRVYFFSEEDCRRLFGEVAGLVERQLLTDRRLQVNRARQLKMYRVWVQANFEKPNAIQADSGSS